jgi:hypothetical protein
MDIEEKIRPLRHALYGLYHAVSGSLSQEQADFVNELLFAFADDPRTGPEEADIYLNMAQSYAQHRNAEDCSHLTLAVNN